jgi:hypothetical protein
MRILRPLESLLRMLQCLLGMLMSGLVIFLAVVRRSDSVCVRGEFVEFRSSLMGIIWHGFSCPQCPAHLRTIPFFKLSNYEHLNRNHALLAARGKRAYRGRSKNKCDHHYSREKNGALSSLLALVGVPKRTDEAPGISY